MTRSVRLGVEWVMSFHPDSECRELALPYTGHIAESFRAAMRSCGHDDIFSWGDDNAWSTDFDHPDFEGDSLNWSDNVHMCYFAGHGGTFHYEERLAFTIAFSSERPNAIAPCYSLSPQWRLGAKMLKWFVIDSCQIVKPDLEPNHISEEWGECMQGVHLVLGFIDLSQHGPNTHNRRVSFAFEADRGVGLANAWLDTSYGWDNPRDDAMRPIVIAAGGSRSEAISRRENENLNWLNSNVTATNWLAWKWRG